MLLQSVHSKLHQCKCNLRISSVSRRPRCSDPARACQFFRARCSCRCACDRVCCVHPSLTGESLFLVAKTGKTFSLWSPCISIGDLAIGDLAIERLVIECLPTIFTKVLQFGLNQFNCSCRSLSNGFCLVLSHGTHIQWQRFFQMTHGLKAMISRQRPFLANPFLANPFLVSPFLAIVFWARPILTKSNFGQFFLAKISVLVVSQSVRLKTSQGATATRAT